MDPSFKHEVAARPGAANVTACYACGTCTAGCPVNEVDERFNPRKLIRMILWGMREELLSSDLIWLCNRCHRCYAHCPQDVRFTDVIGVLREMAVEQGFVDAARLQTIERVDVGIQRLRRDLIREVVSQGVTVGDPEQLETGPTVRQFLVDNRER